MRSHHAEEGARRRRVWTLAALVTAASLLQACDSGSVSVGVGVASPAPWGGVAVGTTVPVVGPYSGGHYAPMW